MKVSPETSAAADSIKPSTGEIRLPQGLVGFPQHNRLELFYQPAELPFVWTNHLTQDLLQDLRVLVFSRCKISEDHSLRGQRRIELDF